MNRYNWVIYITYFLVLLIEIVGEIIFDMNQTPWILYISKPLLMIILIFYTIINYTSENKNKLIITSLIFSLLGDIFLMFHKDELFPLGLGSFLIAHIIYIVIFINHIRKSSNNIGNKYYVLIILVFIILFLYQLLPNIVKEEKTRSLLVPVIVYALTIATMGATSIIRLNSTSKKSYSIVLIGAITFIISDSIIAINKFMFSIPFAYIYIMITYAVGQLCIIRGLLNHKNSE